MQGDHSIHLVLSILTVVRDGSTYLKLTGFVEVLFTLCGNKHGCSEEGSSQTGVKDGLEVTPNIDNKSRCDGGEQTGLFPQKNRVKTMI